jgi:hypothetical protein
VGAEEVCHSPLGNMWMILLVFPVRCTNCMSLYMFLFVSLLVWLIITKIVRWLLAVIVSLKPKPDSSFFTYLYPQPPHSNAFSRYIHNECWHNHPDFHILVNVVPLHSKATHLVDHSHNRVPDGQCVCGQLRTRYSITQTIIIAYSHCCS